MKNLKQGDRVHACLCENGDPVDDSPLTELLIGENDEIKQGSNGGTFITQDNEEYLFYSNLTPPTND